MRAPTTAIALALALVLAGCSGDGRDPAGPVNDPPAEPGDPIPGDPEPGVQGVYVLERINESLPGQLVSTANPDGVLIGLYRFEPTVLTMTALQEFELVLRYTDDKTAFGLEDHGEFKQAGPVAEGALPLAFDSDVYGDSFTGVVLEDIVALKYDFDGDGRHDTSFAFRRQD